MKNDYSDILDHPHYVSKTRPQMSELERAAQFSPFAALTGYDAAISETGRLTDEKIELGEETKAVLDMKQQYLLDMISDQPEITVTYFIPTKVWRCVCICDRQPQTHRRIRTADASYNRREDTAG